MSQWFHPIDDSALVTRARRDVAEAFEELVRRHQGGAYAVSAALGVPLGARDDVVQESFLRAFRALDKLEDAEKFGAWFRQIVRRESLRFLEREPRDDTLGEVDVPRAAEADIVESSELRERVARAVETLPTELREAIFAYYYEGLSTRAAARTLGISVSNLKHRLQRSRELLRLRLGRELAEALGVPAVDRKTTERRARALSLIVIASLPASHSALSAAQTGTAAAGYGSTAGATYRTWIQAGIMSAKNTAITLSTALVLIAAITLWWIASGSDLEFPMANDTRPGESAASLVDANRSESPPAIETEIEDAGTNDGSVAITEPLPVPPVLTGRILDLRGEPVADARVVPLSTTALSNAMTSPEDSTSRDPLTWIRELRREVLDRLGSPKGTTSDADGRFAFSDLSAGEYRILVHHSAFLLSTEAWVNLRPPETVTRDVILNDAQSIRGRVLDDSGAPISDATIGFVRAERRDVKGIGSLIEVAVDLASGAEILNVGSASTDADGRFELGSLEPAIYDVRATRDGYLTAVSENVETGADTPVTLRLVASPPLTGRVVTQNGAPVASATVTIRAPRPKGNVRNPALLFAMDADLRESKTRSTRSADDGSFVIHPPQRGFCEIIVNAEGFLESRRVERLGEKELRLGDVIVESGRMLRGIVLHTDGVAIGARVEVRRSGPLSAGRGDPSEEPLAATRTDSAGRFELGPLPSAPIAVLVIDDAKGSVEQGIAEGDARELELRIPRGQTLEGIVIDAESHEPLSGALVRWTLYPARKTQADTDGRFRFDGIAEDHERRFGSNVHLSAAHEGHETKYSSVEWRPGEVVEIVLSKRKGLRGLIIDATGEPVPGARVGVEIPGLPPEVLILAGGSFRGEGTYSDAEGRFEIRASFWGAGDGSVDVVATHPTHGRGRVSLGPPPAGSAPIASGETRIDLGAHDEVEIALAAGSTIDATVRDASGAPIRLARVALERSAELPAEARIFAEVLPGLTAAVGFTDSDGRATFRGVEQGAYSVIATAVGYARLEQKDFEVVAAPSSIDVVLERGQEISGRVVDRRLASVADVEIVAFDLDDAARNSPARSESEADEIGLIIEVAGQGTASTRTDPQGRYTLDDLARGKYRIVARGDRIIPAEIPAAETGRRLPDIVVERWGTIVLDVRDAISGTPVTNFRVSMQPEVDSEYTTSFTREISSSEGRFENDRVYPGTVGIEVVSVGYSVWRATARLLGGSRREITAVLEPARRVDGIVRSIATGLPIPGASVTLVPAGAGDVPTIAVDLESEFVDDTWHSTGMVFTDETGRFVIEDAKDGAFSIRVRHQKFYDLHARSRASVIVDGASIELAPIDLEPGSEIEVSLRGLPDRRRERVLVSVLAYRVETVDRSNSQTDEASPSRTLESMPLGEFVTEAHVDEKGRTTLTGLPPGTYSLRMQSQDWTAMTSPKRNRAIIPTLLDDTAIGTVSVGGRETARFEHDLGE
jgi:RNA polymerase sigma-70 factor (ECF subfamily)